MTNVWNRFIYACWSPIYDRFVSVSFLASARRRAIETLAILQGERVLLVGVGTGADLPLIPQGTSAVGIDISAAMLRRAEAMLPLEDREIALVQGDVQSIPFEDESFDVAILTLILSVVPDGAACLQETMRVLKPGGRALIFDKFLANGKRPSLVRRLLNLLTRFFGTDINRDFEAMLEKTDSAVVMRDEPSLFNGAYRVILLRKSTESAVPFDVPDNAPQSF